MNQIFIIVGLAILAKGAFDFQGVLFGTKTLDDVMYKNIYFEAGYYYFGIVFSSVSAYLGSRSVKIFSSIIGSFCLLISLLIVLDTLSETKWKAEGCASLLTLNEVTACFKEHGMVK